MSSPTPTAQIVTYGRRLPSGRREAIRSSTASPTFASSSPDQVVIDAILALDAGARHEDSSSS